ncbi:MAG: hypothetical protein Q8N14_06200 [Candidatus Omnitrophota bacterium]|nr:hypothetical protein [Candidatus Omnitrophota bacterium]
MSKSKFFNLPEGEEKEVKFLFVEEVPNHFDGGETVCIRYHLEVDGKEQLWDRTSRELAQDMAKLSEGDTIAIRRTGQKSKTKYFIKKVEK